MTSKAPRGVLVVALAFYGTWLIFPPAAFLVAAALILFDLLT